jgi:tRNA-binding EMAP/Myf-like protein
MRAGEKSSSRKPAASQQTNGVAPAKADKGGKGKKADTRPVDLSLLDLRVGIIKKAQRHPDADTLYVEEVDCGEPEPRTVSLSCSFKLSFHISDLSVWQLYFACIVKT